MRLLGFSALNGKESSLLLCGSKGNSQVTLEARLAVRKQRESIVGNGSLPFIYCPYLTRKTAVSKIRKAALVIGKWMWSWLFCPICLARSTLFPVRAIGVSERRGCSASRREGGSSSLLQGTPGEALAGGPG